MHKTCPTFAVNVANTSAACLPAGLPGKNFSHHQPQTKAKTMAEQAGWHYRPEGEGRKKLKPESVDQAENINCCRTEYSPH